MAQISHKASLNVTIITRIQFKFDWKYFAFHTLINKNDIIIFYNNLHDI